MSDKTHPATSGSLPVTGSGCGIKPDLDKLGEETGFDFSKAKDLKDAYSVQKEKTNTPTSEKENS